MYRTLGFATAACLLAQTGAAQDAFTNAETAGAMMAKACLTATLDLPAEFAEAQAAAKEAGLTALVENPTTGIYGDPSASNFIIGLHPANLACSLTVAAADADDALFDALFENWHSAVTAGYDGARAITSDDGGTKSRQWIHRADGVHHFASSMDWTPGQNLTLTSSFQPMQ